MTSEIEEPKFKLLSQEGDFELRSYESRIVAETVVTGDFADAPSDGFRLLADYIFGNNKSKSKIAMTAPVAQEPQNEKIAMTAPVGQEKFDYESQKNSWRITFTMPSSYNMQNLPTPNNDNVKLRELPPQIFAAIRFSGLNRKSRVEEKTNALKEWIKANGYREKNTAPIYARYNPPWTPWFMRRNEVLIEIKPKS